MNRIYTDRLYVFFNLLIVLSFLSNDIIGKEYLDIKTRKVISPSFLKGIENDSLIQSLEKNFDTQSFFDKVETRIQLGELYCNRVNYQKAYASYWSALDLLDERENLELRARVYDGMGILYSLYEKRDQALTYYKKSLEINRLLVNQEIVPKINLRKNYFVIAVHYRYDKNLDQANTYLDSCLMIPTEGDFSELIVKSERAYLLSEGKQYSSAQKLFDEILPKIEDQQVKSYHVVFYSLYADMFMELHQYEKAIKNYLHSADAAMKYRAHINFVPDIYKKLSTALNKVNDKKAALFYLNAAYTLDQWLYSSKSENNRFLLEINDVYKKKEQEQQKIITQQKIQNVTQEKQILWLSIGILTLVFIFITWLVFTRIRLMKKNYKNERRMMVEKQNLEKEKNDQILAIKNKELTQSTLQIIAKDEVLATVKDKLKELQKKEGSKELRSVLNSIKVNQDTSWLEFEHRFTSANKDFFENLKEKYPNLSTYDLKICALVKLNFTGKEMSRLLGISPESANTSRYRLRKKLGLQKGEDLVEFVNGVV
ncbi:tetratricopeptide repeat protein [Flammeovirga sp. MY04]|uniref:tetratricopeptide repeat protein n=1 Tax=Flammeovirga sp. MY04 TaxID=1191459 RepID=UPI000825E69F|nr:tetratricopeptide repeat protein [Flammeovirga sp. MY04]ANQ49988.2 tetratricopeptide repeat protein [Flammeovirga sp. MY04]